MPVKTRPMPPAEYFHKLLRYDNGVLLWRERPRDEFKTDTAWKSWNARYKDKPALNSITASGIVAGIIGGKLYLAARVVWKMFHEEDPVMLRHKNGLNTDNRIENLIDVGRVRTDHSSDHATTPAGAGAADA